MFRLFRNLKKNTPPARKPLRPFAASFETLEDRSVPATLAQGDIAILAVNSANPDRFSFMNLKALDAGDVINFTDNGFTSGTAGRTGEGFLTFTAPAGGVPIGSVYTWENGMSISGTPWSSNSPSSFAFNGSGDQLFAFTGSTANWASQTGITLLFGINYGTALLTTGTAAAATTYQPTALTTSFINLGTSTFANTYYSGTGSSATSVSISGSQSSILSDLTTSSKWFGNSGSAATFPTYSYGSGSVPTVTTPTQTNITNTSATLGGDVTSDGGAAIIERGVVISKTSQNNDPIIGGANVTKVTGSGTTGAFTVNVTGLDPASGYSFKAYATNSQGTSYTTVDTFSTTAVDNIPPTLVSIVDDKSGQAVAANTPITFTVTFSEDIDSATVTTADFDNAGTAPLTINSVTETAPSSGIFTVQATPTGNGTVILRIPAGAVINDTANNSLVVPVQDNTTINVLGYSTTLYINEILFNPPGTDAPNEYVELRGDPNTLVPEGTYLVGIEGDSGPGDVQTIFNVSGLAFGSNGYLVLLQSGNTYTVDSNAVTLTATGTGFGNLGSPSRFSADSSGTDIENASASFLLITAATAPTLADDIDADDDGVTDGSVYAGWTVRDAIAVLDNGASDKAYAPIVFRQTGGGAGPAGAVYVETTAAANYVARIGTSTGATASDWMAGGLEGTAPNFTMIVGDSYPAVFNGQALNHIGAVNPADTGAPQVSSIVDNVGGGPANVNLAITYTITFNKDIDHTTVSAVDFSNAGSSAITVGAITETAPGVFTVVVTPTTTGTLQLQIVGNITDTASNTLVVPVQDETIITVTAGDTTSPQLVSIVDDQSGGPVIAGTLVTFTVTFNEDIDHTTVTAADFNNAGTAPITIGTITETSPGVFTVQATPTSFGTLILRIPTGADIKDAANNSLVVPVQDDTTIQVSADGFTSGNVAFVLTNELDNNSPLTIVEVSPTTAGQTIATANAFSVPGTGGSAIRMSASATSTGYLANSSDGSRLAFTGVNSSDTVANSNTLNPRVAGVYTADGTLTMPASYTGSSGQQTRAATTIDNTNWFIADQAGIYTNGSTSASPSGNIRAVKAFGTTVYVGQQSSTTTTIQVATVSNFTNGSIIGLPGLTNNSAFQDFYLISSGDNGALYDVLYVVSNTSASSGTISKYSLVSGSWVANGSYATSFGGFGLAAADNGAGAVLYVSTGAGATGANSLIKLSDTAGYNATIAISTPSNVTLFTAPTGRTIKGVAFAPETVVSTTTSLSPPSSSSVNFGTGVTFTGSVTAASGSLPPVGTIELRNYSTGSLLASQPLTGGSGTVTNFSFSNIQLSAGTYTDIRALYVPGVAGDGFGASVSTGQSVTVSPVAYTAGNITALQVDEADFNSTFSIIEVNKSTAGQTAANGFAVPSSGFVPMRISGTGSFGADISNGYLALSNYGEMVSFTGMNTADPASNLSQIALRNVGAMDVSGTFLLENGFDPLANYTGTVSLQTRGATTLDGSTWFISDEGGLYSEGADTANPAGNVFRAVKAFGGTVYVGLQSATSTDIQVSTVPAPSGQPVVGLPGLTNNGDLRDFYLIRSGDSGPFFDVLYVVSSTSATAGSVSKYSLVGGTWVANGSYTTTFGGFGLAAEDAGAGANLYVSTGTGVTTGNSIMKLVDAAGYNAPINISAVPATLYAAPAGKILKGVSFTPQPVVVSVPTVDQPSATNLTTSGATVGGRILSDGNSPITGRGVYYAVASSNPNPRHDNGGIHAPASGTALGNFSVNLTSLSPNTTYAYNVYATNSAGYGYIVSAGTFTTNASAIAPTVTSPTISAIASTSATASANVASDGGATITQRGFVFATTANPQIGGPGVSTSFVSGQTGTMNANLTGLTSGQTYYVRSFATNSVGTTYGPLSMYFDTLATTSTTITNVTPTTGFAGLDAFTFTADVTATAGANPPTAGVVEFRDGGPTGTLIATATAITGTSGTTSTFSITTSSVPVGTFTSVTAYYIAGAGFANSASAPFGSTVTINVASGPIPYTTPGANYTQNFDSLPTASVPNEFFGSSLDLSGAGPFELSLAPFEAFGASGWYAHKVGGSVAVLRARTDNGATSGGAFTNYGSLDSNDRAIGAIGSSSIVAQFGAVLVNNSGTALNEITISYYGEQWRGGGNNNTSPNTLTFQYAFGASDIVTGSFQNQPALNFSSIHMPATATVYDGNHPTNRVLKTHTITGLNWLPGQTLALRWVDADDPGQDDGLAIDDFTFSATTAAASAPEITSAGAASVITGTNVALTVTASGVPAPTYSATGMPGWLTLHPSTGALTGTAPVVSTPTDYTFDITATNSQGSDTEPFTLTVLPTTIAYGTPNSQYQQNFDSLPNTGTYTLTGFGPVNLFEAPIGSNGLYGWSIGASAGDSVKFAVGDGSSNTGNTFAFGALSSSERALGGLASNGTVPRFGAIFTNTSGTTLTSFTISYTGEQWRRGNNIDGNTLAFSYLINGSDIMTGTFIPATELNFISPNTSALDVALDGNDPSNQTDVQATISNITWLPGETLVIRWDDANETGNDDGLAIDDLTFSAAAATAPTKLLSTQIDNGTAQRSMIRSITLTFDAAIDTINTGAIAVTQENGTPISGLTVDVAGLGTSVLTLTFSDATDNNTGPVTYGSLIDGRYKVAIDGGLLVSGGLAVDADGNGSAGGTSETLFTRLFGDVNGDTFMDALDIYPHLINAIDTQVNNPGYNVAFDYDNDGDVDAVDIYPNIITRIDTGI